MTYGHKSRANLGLCEQCGPHLAGLWGQTYGLWANLSENHRFKWEFHSNQWHCIANPNETTGFWSGCCWFAAFSKRPAKQYARFHERISPALESFYLLLLKALKGRKHRRRR